MRLTTIVWIAVLSTACVARAQEPTTAPADLQTVPSESMFPKGLWTFEMYGAGYSSFEASKEGVAMGVAGASYYFDERHAVRFELAGFSMDDNVDDDGIIAIGANIGLRYHFFERGRFTAFLDGSLGLFQADHEFPDGGTNFNFDEQFGLGATWRLDKDVHLIAGARYMHMSNAQIKGKDENPAFNGVGGYIGLVFTF